MHGFPADWLQTQNGDQFRAASSAHSQGSGGTTLAPVGSSALNQYLTERLYHPVTRRAPTDSRGHGERGRVPSAYSQRAKRGYKYWVDDKKSSIRKCMVNVIQLAIALPVFTIKKRRDTFEIFNHVCR